MFSADCFRALPMCHYCYVQQQVCIDFSASAYLCCCIMGGYNTYVHHTRAGKMAQSGISAAGACLGKLEWGYLEKGTRPG